MRFFSFEGWRLLFVITFSRLFAVVRKTLLVSLISKVLIQFVSRRCPFTFPWFFLCFAAARRFFFSSGTKCFLL